MRRCGPDLHLLHVESLLQFTAGDSDSDEEDVDYDAQCPLVRASVDGDAVGGCRLGFRRRWR